MDNKEKYIAFCKAHKNIPIFSQAWWLDAACGEGNWDVALFEKNDQIIACLPYYRIKKNIFQIITMPPQTKFMGVYLKYPVKQTHEKKLSYEKDIMNQLIALLPQFDDFTQNFYYDIQNWLPFYWNGFSQSTQYSYVINDLTDLDKVVSNFNHAKRKNIKKAEKLVTVKYDLPAKTFYDNHKMTLQKQGQDIAYTFETFNRLHDSAYEHSAAKTIYAIDDDNNIHSALFIIWDENSAYDLISTIDPEFRHSGSASLLVREAINYVANKTKKFDFEGSMIENVENSFRKFGAIQTPYFKVTKTNSKLLKTLFFARDITR